MHATINKWHHNMDIRKKILKDMDTNVPMTNTNMYQYSKYSYKIIKKCHFSNFAFFLNLKVKLKLNKILCDKYLFYMYMYNVNI